MSYPEVCDWQVPVFNGSVDIFSGSVQGLQLSLLRVLKSSKGCRRLRVAPALTLLQRTCTVLSLVKAVIFVLFLHCDRRFPPLACVFGPSKTRQIAALSYLNARRCAVQPTPAMDIVLEVLDTFVFDPIYATLLPAASQSLAPNATYSSLREEPTSFVKPHSSWQYEPSTHHFSIQPSQYAYQSALNRDDWRRQALTLFLITWCAPSHSTVHHTR